MNAQNLHRTSVKQSSLACHSIRAVAAHLLGSPSVGGFPGCKPRQDIQRALADQTMAERISDAKVDYAFEIISEEQTYRRYLTLYNRTIKFPASGGQPAAVHKYDIVGHPQCQFHFTTVFPFHSTGDKQGEVTLLREHCQGPNQMMWVLPTGGFDPLNHVSHLDCAQSELSEESMLKGGTWQPLIPDGHPGIAEVKWCANRFTPYLCIDPEVNSCAGERDAEEFIEVHRVSIEELKKIMVSGNMLLPSVSTCFIAMERLTILGHL